MTFEWINAVAGFGVGLLVGLTGVGGGALMTPIMLLLFGVSPSVAVGTDLWFAAITKIVGGAVHGKQGSVDWLVLRRLFYGSLPAAVLTLAWMAAVEGKRDTDPVIVTALGSVLILTSVAAMFRTRFHRVGERLRARSPNRFRSVQPVGTVVAGALLGFLVTFTSIGAGALGAVMLLYLYPRRMSPKTLVGTDIVHAIPLTILAGTGHLLMGNVNFPLLGSLLVGSLPGILLGSLGTAYVPDRLVRSAISIVLVAVGIKMVLM